ncbi:MAG: thioredoxin-dependent thiol peroxidase [Planctomycetota bacterium]
MRLIEEGKKAPAFTLKDQDGNTHRLKDYAGQAVVLYFYPKDDTSGCTKQACQFRDDLPAFEKADAVVLGVSPQDEKSKAKFAAKHELNFPLLADVKADADGNPAICEKYGVWTEKSMYGKKYMGVQRTTYLIDGSGKVVRRWDKVKVPGHAEDVLSALSEL